MTVNGPVEDSLRDMPPRRATLSVALTGGALLAIAAPATAERVPVADAAGDTAQRGLDIIGVVFANRDQSIVSRLTFSEDRPGTVIVMAKARHGSGVYIVSQHDRVGPDDTYLFVRGGEGETRCRGLSSAWNRGDARLTLRMPARCLDGGSYGAVRFWALTENDDLDDIDYAPEDSTGDLGITDWLSRG